MSTPSSESSRLSHQLRVLRRGAWIVLLIGVLVTGAAVGISVRQEALYRASADVFLGSESLSSNLTQSVDGARDPERDIKTQAQLARVPAVAERAVAEANPDQGPQNLLDNSSVTSSGQADILTFSVTAPGRQLATRSATAYAEAYTDYRRSIDTSALVEARERIEAQLAELREAGVSRTSRLYSTFEARRGELRTAEALRGSKALLVRPASIPSQIQPKPVRNGILGAVLGLFLGIAIVLLRDALNTRVHSEEEVQERLGLPLLARIPTLPGATRASGDLTMLTDPRAVHAEAFRVLATNLEFSNIDRGARTIMVTSADRSEGKSTTLVNLAAAFARRGQRVVLADLDLRRPTIASLFGLDREPGATDVALGRVPLEQALVRVPLMDLVTPAESSTNGAHAEEHATAPAGTLEVLPSGTLPPDASELMTSPSIQRLIAQLGARADLVLLDAPPILQVSDALALSAHVDALIAVTKLPELRRPVLDELRRVLDNAPIVKLGLVVTGVSRQEGHGYGYGYGLASADQGIAGKRPFPVRLGRARDRV